MKKIVFITLVLFFCSQGNAQGLFDKIKDKVKEKVEEKTDETIQEGVDEAAEKVEEDVSGNKEEEPQQNEGETSEIESQETSTENTGKPVKQQDELKAYSKYDFIPGDKVIFYEDFSSDNIGDFPAAWNTNASGEVVTLNNYPGKWFGPGPAGYFTPDMLTGMPENCTIEFDLIYVARELNPEDFEIKFISSLPEDRIDDLVPGNGGVGMRFGPYGYTMFNWKEQNYLDIDTRKDNNILLENSKKKVRVSIWFQKQRARLWINETKIFDIPRVVPKGLTFDKIRFGTWENDEPYFFISNLRIAAGAPDMRNKLLTEGKLVTRGILFDVNSDKIKAESYGTLKEIAGILKENGDVRVKIVGHTDSDGADAANLDLSKRRAASVKTSLSQEFEIDESRMETDGKGESEPSDKNDTLLGKANNRRVEFIKL